jgi:hypothetical protein
MPLIANLSSSASNLFGGLPASTQAMPCSRIQSPSWYVYNIYIYYFYSFVPVAKNIISIYKYHSTFKQFLLQWIVRENAGKLNHGCRTYMTFHWYAEIFTDVFPKKQLELCQIQDGGIWRWGVPLNLHPEIIGHLYWYSIVHKPLFMVSFQFTKLIDITLQFGTRLASTLGAVPAISGHTTIVVGG